MINFSRKISITQEVPKQGDVNINVTVEYPLQFVKHKKKDVVLVDESISIRIGGIADVMMHGETLYESESLSEMKALETYVKKNKKLPEDVEKELMNHVAARAILALMKASYEIGIPPPVPLPKF